MCKAYKKVGYAIDSVCSEYCYICEDKINKDNIDANNSK
jgi:hypothetical protein